MSEQILVVRPAAIGDSLLTFPLLEALRAASGGRRIALVGNRSVLPLAQHLGVADEVYDYEDLAWSELFAEGGIRRGETLALLRRTQRAICWLSDPTGLVERNLRAAGVAEVRVVPGRPPPQRLIHVGAYLAETLSGWLSLSSGETTTILGRAYRLPETAGTESAGAPTPAPLALHPGASTLAKCWPARHFAALIVEVWRRDLPVLLLAGPADHAQLKALLAELPSQPPAKIKVLINAPLLQVAQHLQRVRGYVGNDSGITHLAALLGVPTVALFGPTEPAVWRPCGPAVVVLRAQPLERLPVEQVLPYVISV
jgi:heptosyltransferase-3